MGSLIAAHVRAWRGALATVVLSTTALALGACEAGRRTQVMVVINADYQVAGGTERLRVRVLGGEEREERALEEIGSAGAPVDFPIRVALVPEGSDLSRPFRVEVTALLPDGTEAVTTAVESRFVPHATVRLAVDLELCCWQSWGTCPSGQTCRACECRPVGIDPASLIAFDADAGARRGGFLAPMSDEDTWAPPVGGCDGAVAPTADYGRRIFYYESPTVSSFDIALSTEPEPGDPDPVIVIYDVGADWLLPADASRCRAYADDTEGLGIDRRLVVTIEPRTTVAIVVTRTTPGPLPRTVKLRVE